MSLNQGRFRAGELRERISRSSETSCQNLYFSPELPALSGGGWCRFW
jgi:hypothetical protein